jgi:hypothetical protein
MADPGISPSEMEAVLRAKQAERELRDALAENKRLKAAAVATEHALRTAAHVLRPYAPPAKPETNGNGTRRVMPEKLTTWTRRK